MTATVTDDSEVGAVVATLSLAPGTTFPLARSGAAYAAEIALADLPFDTFEGEVTAAVRATDGAGNEATAEAAAPVGVTRLRWTYEAGLPLSAPAVTDDGVIVLSRAGSSNQALAVTADGTLAWEVSIGTQVVNAAPMVGAGAIWFPSTNGTLYQVALDGTKRDAECATGGALNAPAALAGSNLTFAVVGSEANSLYVANNQGACMQEPVGAGVKVSPVVGRDGTLFAVLGSVLQAFEMGSGGGLNDVWTSPPTVGTGSASLALDSDGHAWTVSSLGAVNRTSDGSAVAIGTAAADANGLIILPDGSAVLGDDSG
ncbi:MAG TPA: pyrrolo-quinoline quinone, partial [Anaeromyxobacteraceae bacterium]|nr:pyrrolo-quinoline quinone [Anaeromyxobacteraceae bacterium]